MTELNKTAHKILDVAESYTQALGFNAFSYKDIQTQVGIKTSSIHYYFPTKKDLAFAMAARYVENFHAVLAELKARHKSGIKRLEALSQLFARTVNEQKFCVCGMLASDLGTLPDKANSKLQEFFTLNRLWVADAIDRAKELGEIRSVVDSQKTASLFLALLEGGMLIARTQKHAGYLESVVQQAMTLMKE